MIKKLHFVHPFVLGALILLLVLACKKEKTPGTAPQEKINNEIILQNNPEADVHFFATAKNAELLESFNLLDYSELVGRFGSHYEQEISHDTLHITLPEIRGAQIVELMAFGTSEFYNTRLMINPGDSIYLSLENSQITFTGPKAIEQGFFNHINTDELAWPNYTNSIQDYKTNVQDIYKKRKTIFEDFVKKNTNISAEFLSNVDAEMKYEYLYQLVNPRSLKPTVNTENPIFFNDTDGLLNTMRITDTNNEELLDSKWYYDDVKIEDFQKPEFVNNDYFKRALSGYIRHYFAEYEYLNYSKETFRAEKEFIHQNLSDGLENYALGRLIYEYSKRGFGRGLDDRKILHAAIAEFKSNTSDPAYLEPIEDIEELLETIGYQFQSNILNEKVVNVHLDTLTIGDILKENKKGFQIFDFWASWCPPCIKDIKESKNFKSKISSNYDIKWIYLSVDEDETVWLKKVKQLDPFITSKHNYKFVRPFKSKLLKRVGALEKNNITIPQYTIVGSEKQILLVNAPRPSDSLSFKQNLDFLFTEE